MRLRSRLAAAAVAVTFVAGIGMAGSPAQAKTTSTVSGTARLPFLPSVLASLSVNGVQFNATPAATSEGEGGASQTLVFPVTKPARGGALPLEGGISVGASLARLYLTAPRLEYASGAGAGQGRITFQVTDMPADGPAELANGTRIALFAVSSLDIKTRKGRVVQSGKTWTRTDTQRITGQVAIANDASLVTSVNSFIGTSFFTPDLPFSTLNSVITTKVTCSTRAACR